MNRLSLTYRLIGAALALLVFTGATMPSGLHHKQESMMEMCENMKPVHDMDHHECDFGFACACSIDQAPIETQAKVSVVPVIIKADLAGLVIFGDQQVSPKPTHLGQQHLSLSESSPPIFLKNSSFLN